MKPRILIFEDEDGIREIEKALLVRENYEVEATGDPEEGIRIAAGSHFDLVICDIMMPKMDGYQVIQELRKHPTSKNVPVMYITALDEQRDRIKGLNLGAVEYFNKPFSAKDLLTKIKEVLISYKKINA